MLDQRADAAVLYPVGELLASVHVPLPPLPASYVSPHASTFTVTAVEGGPSVTYRPPFGTLGANGAVWEVQSPASADLRLYVKVVGITGKVMISATQD